MSKKLEYSEDMTTWKVIGACPDDEFQEKWAALQQWIEEQQPYGFFRAIDDSRSVQEIIDSIKD
jgi:hypothetical protein